MASILTTSLGDIWVCTANRDGADTHISSAQDCGTVKPAYVMSISYASVEHILSREYAMRECAEYAKVSRSITSLYFPDCNITSSDSWASLSCSVQAMVFVSPFIFSTQLTPVISLLSGCLWSVPPVSCLDGKLT
jgi:hypothetical protein